MKERLDQRYLKPQMLLLERTLKEWTVICLIIVFPWFIHDNWDDYPLYALIFGCIGPWVVGLLFYMVPRMFIGSYLNVRRVVMEDDSDIK